MRNGKKIDLKVKIENGEITFDKKALMEASMGDILYTLYNRDEPCEIGKCDFGSTGECARCGHHRPAPHR